MERRRVSMTFTHHVKVSKGTVYGPVACDECENTSPCGSQADLLSHNAPYKLNKQRNRQVENEWPVRYETTIGFDCRSWMSKGQQVYFKP
jgi:hypothetical protein